MGIVITAETLRHAGVILVLVCLAILIIYCVVFMKNLIKTVQQTNSILEDANVISNIAAERTKDVDKIISDVSETVGNVAENVKKNQSTISAFTTVVKAVMSIKNMVKKDDNETSQ